MMPKQKMAAIAARYASALFALTRDTPAAEQASLRAMGETLARWLKEHEGLAALVHNPQFTRAQKEAGLLAVMQRAQAAPLLQNFVRLVCRKGRVFLLPQILDAWQAQCAAAAGEERVEVRTAHALSEEQAARLTRMLTRPGRPPPQLEIEIAPELLAGFIVQRGSQWMDVSVRGQLQRAAQKMKEAGDGY